MCSARLHANLFDELFDLGPFGPKAQANVSAFHILGDTLESAAESFEEATANAHESARRAAGVTKSALANALYKACYGISYGAVYSSVFLVEMMPEGGKMRSGFTEGAEAAITARKKAVERKSSKPKASAKRTVKPKTRAGKSGKTQPTDLAEAG